MSFGITYFSILNFSNDLITDRILQVDIKVKNEKVCVILKKVKIKVQMKRVSSEVSLSLFIKLEL